MASSDPTGRTAGQYARATVMRLRMRTLVILGVLAVATALLGRVFGLHSLLFLASEIGLLISIFPNIVPPTLTIWAASAPRSMTVAPLGPSCRTRVA